MRIGVLGAPDSWYLRDLQRAAGSRHEVIAVAFRGLSSGVAMGADWPCTSSQGLHLDTFEALLVRAMSLGSLEQVVFRMDVLGQYWAQGGLVVNPPRTVEAAVDKYLALVRLQATGLPVPRTVVCQNAADAMAAFVALGGDVVVKPLFGAEGRGIARVSDEALALRVFSTLEQLQAVLYLQEFLPHPHHDLRLLVVGNRVLGMKRTNPQDWRTNISRGARGEPLAVSDKLAELALRAAAAVGGSFVGVDVVPGRGGQLYVIEVNAAPGWKGLARVTGCDVAALVLEHLRELATGRDPTSLPPPA